MVGRALLSRASRLRLSFDDIVREAADLNGGRAGHLRIGVATGLADLLLAPAYSAIVKEAPSVTLAARVDSYPLLALAVRKGELDFAIGPLPQFPERDFAYQHLYDDDEFVVYASIHHRLCTRRTVTIADLAQERFVFTAPDAPAWQALERAFAERGLDAPRLAVSSGSLTLRLPIVAATELLGYSSLRVVKLAATRYAVKNSAGEGVVVAAPCRDCVS